MKFTGKLLPPVIDYSTGRMTILFAPQEDFSRAYEELKDKDKLSLEIKPYKAYRSLDANAYYWVLVSKLAKRLETSNAELHNIMLRRYGTIEIINNQIVRLLLEESEETDKKVNQSEYYHFKPTAQVKEMADGKMYRTYVLIRGSSTYNTEEMARLINGLISECKDAGMSDAEIATPNEKRLLKEKYNVNL